MTRFFRWLKWLKNGKPYLSYEGFHCGLCGAWEGEPFRIPEYESHGKWWDTWGVCKKCIEEGEKFKGDIVKKEKINRINPSSVPKIKCIFLAIVMVFVLCSVSQAREVNLSYGENIHWLDGAKNVGLESKMLELEIRGPIKSWLKLGIVGNMIQSDKIGEPYNIDGRIFNKGSYTTFIFSGKLTAHKTFLKIMFTELYAGLGLTAQNHYPGFGDSGAVGNFGASIGVKLMDRCIVKYGLSHWSDPLQHHDKGHNFQYISISMSW